MQKVYSVGQINQYISQVLRQDFILGSVSIRGEVSNVTYHTSGHVYFSLKDEAGRIACVLFASARSGLKFRLREGQQVIASGHVDIFARDGKYQLYVKSVRQEGAGALYERYLALKEELEEMGMFAPEYKKPIPAFAHSLGIVTAPTGAAVHDIIQISTRRNPGIRIILYPAKVQGEGAAKSVAAGIAALDALGLDVLIVGRGGGSIEELWAFNEEIVARALFECNTPVISAVGHETDTTIADFAADLRAPTPSAAAELAVCDVRALLSQLMLSRSRMERRMRRQIEEERNRVAQLQLARLLERMLEEKRSRLERYRLQLRYASPRQRLLEQRQYLSRLEDALRHAMGERLRERRHRMELAGEKLKRLSPREKLSGGYGYVVGPDGRRMVSVGQAAPGDTLQIYLADGRLEATVSEIKAW